MPRNLDPALAAGVASAAIQPAYLAALTFRSGVEYVWTGLGDLPWNGRIFKGVGALAGVGPIGEGTGVKADGTTVTLMGIGQSSVPFPVPANVPAPPIPVPAGQAVAWALPQTVAFGPQPAHPTATNGSATATTASQNSAATAALAMTSSSSLGNTIWGAQWSDFAMPASVPAGATITGVYPVVTCSATAGDASAELHAGQNLTLWADTAESGTDFYTGHFSVRNSDGSITLGSYSGSNAGSLAGLSIGARLFDTSILPVFPAPQTMHVSFVGLAVYYIAAATPSQATLIHEALSDIRLGASAKLWFALRAGGAFVGTPYLLFNGTVDKPTVHTGVDSISITLALENRLVNLQRANQRRYTAADQHLAFPDDTGFNQVEILNDIALRWGS